MKAETLEHAIHLDPTVNEMMQQERPLDEIIVALVNQKLALHEQIMEFMLIAPRKIVLKDGTRMVWHCPDEFVPETLI